MDEKTYDDGLRDGKIEAIEGSLKGLRESMDSMGEALRGEMAPIRKALVGNGSPKGSLISSCAVLCSKVAFNRLLIVFMLTSIVGLFVSSFFH